MCHISLPRFDDDTDYTSEPTISTDGLLVLDYAGFKKPRFSPFQYYLTVGGLNRARTVYFHTYYAVNQSCFYIQLLYSFYIVSQHNVIFQWWPIILCPHIGPAAALYTTLPPGSHACLEVSVSVFHLVCKYVGRIFIIHNIHFLLALFILLYPNF